MVKDEVGAAHGAGVVRDERPLGGHDVVHVEVVLGVGGGLSGASDQSEISIYNIDQSE